MFGQLQAQLRWLLATGRASQGLHKMYFCGLLDTASREGEGRTDRRTDGGSDVEREGDGGVDGGAAS